MMNQNNKVYWNLNDQMQHQQIEVQHRLVMEEYKYKPRRYDFESKIF